MSDPTVQPAMGRQFTIVFAEDDGRPAGDFVALEFRDSGGGIAPEVLERVFEPFVTTKPDGSGLGLSQVYGFAQQVGGAAVIDSSAEGTRVTLYLPRVPAASLGFRSPSSAAAVGAT